MATKSYKLRLDLRPWADKPLDDKRFKNRKNEVESTRRWLDDTREAFNAGVDYLTGWLLRMHRGAGVWREKKDGVWRKWQEISTLDKLKEARERYEADPGSFALLENHKLLDVFKSRGMSEDEAVELAEGCRRIVKELCPPGSDEGDVQVSNEFRHALDPLTNPDSTAFGLRPRGHAKDGQPKKVSGQRPGWLIDKTIWEESRKAQSLEELCDALTARSEFQSAKKKGAKRIAALRQRYGSISWVEAHKQLAEFQAQQFEELLKKSNCLRDFLEGAPRIWQLPSDRATRLSRSIERKYDKAEWGRSKHELQLRYAVPRWEAAKIKSEQKRQASEMHGSIAAYRRLLECKCLPIPEFQRPSQFLKSSGLSSEWNYAMWNMAGQRVRSHLGWVDRRENERMLWELRTTLFERGGWLRVKPNGKPIKKEDLTPEDIRFEEAADFQQQPAYGRQKWVETLRQYESDEMLKDPEGVAFGAAEQPRIRKRTARGWAKVREKWLDLIEKADKAGKAILSSSDLIDALNKMRKQKASAYSGHVLFDWLAVPKRRWLWDGTNNGNDNNCGRADRDCITAFVAHNEHLADKPKSITFTQSDPVKHPVWPFFGENSAVEYWLRRERTPGGEARLVLILKQLLARQADGSYAGVDRVKIALRGYKDFESSFALPDEETDVSAKQTLVFRDDLLDGATRAGTLSGIKLTWERDELEAASRKRHSAKKVPRVYANFSCDAGVSPLPDWLTKSIGYLDKKNTRDGMRGLFKLDSGIRLEGSVKRSASDAAEVEPGRLRPPGSWTWPKEAIDNAFAVRGTDLGYRTSSAGAWWRLSLKPLPERISWKVGKCGEQDVYAVLERIGTVSLPGDGEPLPSIEQDFHERLYSLRARLNLDNALLRIVRLLTLNCITRRIETGDKTRKRSDGTTKRIGVRWKTETKALSDVDIRQNCRKAGELLLRWESTEAMNDSLTAIRHDGKLWHWLEARNIDLSQLGDRLPATILPDKEEAKKQSIDGDLLKGALEQEHNAFAAIVHELRVPLAKALCDDYDAERHVRAKSGLWAEFDNALLRELSYSQSGNAHSGRTIFDSGLFRLLRKPPVTKHRDRKDDANNLPHGRTHRGGLSMSRLNFLDDVKNFVRRWSCRPRWPGDLRRVPDDAKFDRCDTEHLDNLRQHRVKLIAHADVAQTLGFQQDLRRGLWLFKAPSGELLWHRPERGHFYRQDGESLVQCSTPDGITVEDANRPHPAFGVAHVLVYEDLTRYKMSSDRPKKENAGLARWSHRRILEFSLHVGGLFGVPIAIVDARFSSRLCSHCGAPGSRADRFDPKWLGQRWMQRVLESNDRHYAPLKSVAMQVSAVLSKDKGAFNRKDNCPWVLRDGGTHFVCSNATCSLHTEPINADENAAANIGLRFLRGVEAIRVTINGRGAVTKSIGYVSPNTILETQNSGAIPFWTAISDKETQSGKRAAKFADVSEAASGGKDEDEISNERYLFRDPSGAFRSADRWFEGKIFWHDVAAACADGIQAANTSRFGTEADD